MARRRPQTTINDADQAGAYFGGNRNPTMLTPRGNPIPPSGSRVPDRLEKINQTTFRSPGEIKTVKAGVASFSDEGKNLPIYPEPQSIKFMPPQLAGYDDKFNKRGKIASTENMGYLWHGDVDMDKFLHDVETVYINPSYKNEYIQAPITADRKEARAKQVESIGLGLDKFAQANSRYFGKQFKVLPLPINTKDEKPEGKRVNPNKSLILDIRGDNRPYDRYLAAAPARPFTRLNTNPKQAGVDSEFTPGVYRDWQMYNTAFNSRPDAGGPVGKFRRYVDSGTAAQAFQHEFGHNLGINHPANVYEDKNTKMAYSEKAKMLEEKLGPSDINFYQQAYRDTKNERLVKNNKSLKGGKVPKKR